MTYRQITAAERYTLRVLQVQELCPAAIARALGRHRSTMTREIARNRARSSGYYRPELGERYARGRRSHSRWNSQFTAADWAAVEAWLVLDWSPEQIAGWCARHRLLAISHETIYRHVWQDQANGGTLYTHLRGARKQRRKRYGAYDSRGRLPENGRLPRGPPAPRIARATAAGKATRCLATAKAARVFSRSSNANRATQ